MRRLNNDIPFGIYDVLVIGGGHAGCEAALAAARLGCKTLLITMALEKIALMSCNPAIGGLAKGHLVREIDALGGEMARCIDQTGIQFKLLNKSKGPAVQALRAQADREAYRLRMKAVLERQSSLELKEALAEKIITAQGTVQGIRIRKGDIYQARKVILAPGTFLNGLIHIGLNSYAAGRADEPPSRRLSLNLKKMGLSLGRLKTGTPPRLRAQSVDFSRLEAQYGDPLPLPFSYSTAAIKQRQVACYLTYTNPLTHRIIRENLDRSPLYSGIIKGIGPRYCPSIEDKVIRFARKESHQIFLEPEGRESEEIYANGISTSLPLEVQKEFLRTIKGLERAEIIRPGYAIEYDFVSPLQLYPSLETKRIKGLFLAGQINGTSGYEEAAGQGLVAGINAVLSIRGEKPLILDRSQAYLGVLIDDLVTKGTDEPYRMFTSRAEYRLLLRHDNADLRLREIGYKIGLISEKDYRISQEKKRKISQLIFSLNHSYLQPTAEVNRKLKRKGIGKVNQTTSLAQLLKRPGTNYSQIFFLNELPLKIKLRETIPINIKSLSLEIIQQAEMEIKYEGYIRRQLGQVRRFKELEKKKLPLSLNYAEIPGLSREVREKLKSIKPLTLGQASRISGVTPAAMAILAVYLEKLRRGEKRNSAE